MLLQYTSNIKIKLYDSTLISTMKDCFEIELEQEREKQVTTKNQTGVTILKVDSPDPIFFLPLKISPISNTPLKFTI